MKTLRIHPLPAIPQPPAGPPADPGWRLGRLLTAPHRLGFAAAALVMTASALWWLLALATRQVGLAWPWAVPAPVAHGLLMSLGFMPLFITGFLFTAGPRWLDVPPVAALRLRVPVVIMLGGWLLALPGFHFAGGLAALGVAVVALGWTGLVLRFVPLLHASRVSDQLHARLVATACGLGVAALWLAALGLALGDMVLARAAALAAVWGFLAPTCAVVSHRMLPFFTESALPGLDAWRPNWLLWLKVGVLWLAGTAVVAESFWWPLPAALYAALAVVEAPAGLLLLWLASRWGLVRSLRMRMLAMLHAGFVWLGLAMLLSAASHALMAAGGPAAGLGLAPLHALTVGYLGAMLFAMITRVTAGHSGRPLAADDLAWALYWAVQTAAVLRVGAALWPDAATPLTLAAAGAWLVAAAGWTWRYGAWLGRPRADGRPG